MILAQVAAYLADERDRGRIAADAGIGSAPSPWPAAGICCDPDPGPPGSSAVQWIVATVPADVVQRLPG